MTDNEIIKALECCYKDGCKECPLWECKEDCFVELIKHNVLDLINRLQDEREALISGQETLQKYIAEKNAEIERLETKHSEMCIGMKRLKSKAIKEFWEKLKETRQWDVDIPEYVFTASGDNLLKEMEES